MNMSKKINVLIGVKKIYKKKKQTKEIKGIREKNF